MPSMPEPSTVAPPMTRAPALTLMAAVRLGFATASVSVPRPILLIVAPPEMPTVSMTILPSPPTKAVPVLMPPRIVSVEPASARTAVLKLVESASSPVVTLLPE